MPTSTPLGAAAAAPGLGPHGGFRSGVALAAPILATLTSTTNTNANRPAATAAPHPPHRPTRGASTLVRRATNGNGSAADASSSNSGGGGGGGAPSAAETARTVAAMVAEGTLSTLCPEGGCPVGTPVGFHLDKNGQAWVEPGEAGPALANLSADARCSLTVQPAAYPARSVACVTLVGQVDVSGTGPAYPLRVEKALYFGGLDAVRCSGPGGAQAKGWIEAQRGQVGLGQSSRCAGCRGVGHALGQHGNRRGRGSACAWRCIG
eukprot:350689-Chlamydomonas_euryale.AAC.6